MKAIFKVFGVVVGSLAAAFATIAIVASAATLSTAFLANMIALPGVLIAFATGAWRTGSYGVVACAACLVAAILVQTLSVPIEYLILAIYSCLVLSASILGCHYWTKNMKVFSE